MRYAQMWIDECATWLEADFQQVESRLHRDLTIDMKPDQSGTFVVCEPKSIVIDSLTSMHDAYFIEKPSKKRGNQPTKQQRREWRKLSK